MNATRTLPRHRAGAKSAILAIAHRIGLRTVRTGLALMVVGVAQAAWAGIVHNETVNGDLSSNRFSPTVLTLSPGANSILATSQAGDREFFSVAVPAGGELSALFLASYSLSDIGFIGVQRGPTMTVNPDTPNAALLLGYAHFGQGNRTVGTDILDDIGRGFGAMGFFPPLPSGTYTFWSQQTGPAATYQFDLILVPEPTTTLLLALGLAGLALAGRRRLGR